MSASLYFDISLELFQKIFSRIRTVASPPEKKKKKNCLNVRVRKINWPSSSFLYYTYTLSTPRPVSIIFCVLQIQVKNTHVKSDEVEIAPDLHSKRSGFTVRSASRAETSFSPIFLGFSKRLRINSSRAAATERLNPASHQRRTLVPEPGQHTSSFLAISNSLAFVPPRVSRRGTPPTLQSPHLCLRGRRIQGEEEVAGRYSGKSGWREMGEGRGSWRWGCLGRRLAPPGIILWRE